MAQGSGALGVMAGHAKRTAEHLIATKLILVRAVRIVTLPQQLQQPFED
jgi:hypothetical protein